MELSTQYNCSILYVELPVPAAAGAVVGIARVPCFAAQVGHAAPVSLITFKVSMTHHADWEPYRAEFRPLRDKRVASELIGNMQGNTDWMHAFLRGGVVHRCVFSRPVLALGAEPY